MFTYSTPATIDDLSGRTTKQQFLDAWNKFINEPELRRFISTLKDENGQLWAADAKSRGCMYNPLRGEWEFANKIGGPIFNYFLAVQRSK